MDEEFLSKAGIGWNSHWIEQEDSQHGRKGGEGQTQVRDGQQGKEIIHGLMKWGLCLNDKENGAVARDGNQVHEENGNGEPDVGVFQSWDSNKKKKLDLRIIESRHEWE